jgi:hypothetical protein
MLISTSLAFGFYAGLNILALVMIFFLVPGKFPVVVMGQNLNTNYRNKATHS